MSEILKCYYHHSFDRPDFDCSRCPLDTVTEAEGYCGAECPSEDDEYTCGGTLIAVPGEFLGDWFYKCNTCGFVPDW